MEASLSNGAGLRPKPKMRTKVLQETRRGEKMRDKSRTKEALLAEMAALRQRVAELEAVKRVYKWVEEELAKARHYDLLTGLPSNTLFFNHLNQAVALARRNDRQLAVLFFSLDPRNRRDLGTLDDMGAEIAISDFGIDSITTEHNNTAISRAIIPLAHSLGSTRSPKGSRQRSS